MRDVLGNLAEQIGEDYHHPLLDARGDQRYLVVLITADKGLCGAFNTNLLKAGQAFLREHSGKDIEMLPVGRKGRDFFRRRQVKLAGEFVGLTGKGRVDFSEALEVAREIIKRFKEDESLDRVFLIFSEFKSVLTQRVAVEQILPISRGAEGSETAADPSHPVKLKEYIYEQPPAEIFGRLLPRLIQTQVFRALLESVASEHGARMTAMEAASKNAGELISTLTLNMNRVRQAAITREIIEIVSGAAAL
jgi:F-type H+-transporting ATPase subunit gamma